MTIALGLRSSVFLRRQFIRVGARWISDPGKMVWNRLYYSVVNDAFGMAISDIRFLHSFWFNLASQEEYCSCSWICRYRVPRIPKELSTGISQNRYQDHPHHNLCHSIRLVTDEWCQWRVVSRRRYTIWNVFEIVTTGASIRLVRTKFSVPRSLPDSDVSSDWCNPGWSRSSRTDAGVHASGVVVSAKLLIENESYVKDGRRGFIRRRWSCVSNAYCNVELPNRMNDMLPPDIRIFGASIMPR